MNWDYGTASGREKMIIQYRKLTALYAMMPDLFPDTPYESFKYLAEDCVLTSEKLDRPLSGVDAVKDFLIREKRSYDGLKPIPICQAAMSEDDDVLLRIRPWKADEGELVRLELNGDGLIRRIDRFSEKRIPYRTTGPSITLTPAKEKPDSSGVTRNDDLCVFIADLYEDDLRLLFYLQGDVFTDMEDCLMNMDEWVTLVDNWRKLNETEDPDTLRANIMKAEEEYTSADPRYARELGELIDSFLDHREPYGRRMQAMLEDWVNAVKDDYGFIRKC
ncbi:MAG: hypothetical protein IJR97_04910 [Clostridia bacterium]|nr:hypothetical protein [Clostridia bacterium]